MNFQKDDIAIVISNGRPGMFHGFNIGDEVKILSYDKPNYLCYGARRDLEQYLSPSQLRHVRTEGPRGYGVIVIGNTST